MVLELLADDVVVESGPRMGNKPRRLRVIVSGVLLQDVLDHLTPKEAVEYFGVERTMKAVNQYEKNIQGVN